MVEMVTIHFVAKHDGRVKLSHRVYVEEGAPLDAVRAEAESKLAAFCEEYGGYLTKDFERVEYREPLEDAEPDAWRLRTTLLTVVGDLEFLQGLDVGDRPKRAAFIGELVGRIRACMSEVE